MAELLVQPLYRAVREVEAGLAMTELDRRRDPRLPPPDHLPPHMIPGSADETSGVCAMQVSGLLRWEVMCLHSIIGRKCKQMCLLPITLHGHSLPALPVPGQQFQISSLQLMHLMRNQGSLRYLPKVSCTPNM